MTHTDGAEGARVAPRTATERRLAAVWAPLIGVDEDAVGRDDHFFDRGASSLLAVKMAVRLGREVSLSDITRHPVLADLAALMDGRAAASTGLLQALAEPDGPTRATVVGIPPAGGHAVSFRPLAAGLRGTGLAVHAVELPGHDPTVDDEPFVPLAEVADRVAGEIVERALPDVLLWGHSAGAAVALAVARRLEARGVPPRRVVLGAQLLGTAAARRRDAAELDARSDAEVAVRLAGPYDVGGVMAELDPRRVERSAAAYRHDCQLAHAFLVDVLEHPPAARLATPVTVVVAADDPSTTGFVEHYRDWELVAGDVTLHVLDQGGHHFLRTRPVDAARAVLHAADLAPTS
ncbi:MAG TPA: alpha/beta fold hydrolase [Actinomycetospora sp.]|nr:alpha/beta fold hydrolase [Actinomycetospora sp.]